LARPIAKKWETFPVSHFTLTALLTKKYGEPINSDWHWSNPSYASDPGGLGLAISRGHVNHNSEWKTKETEIFAIISGDNCETRVVAEYSSVALNHLEDAYREQQALDDL
jgi:hypothetical protein